MIANFLIDRTPAHARRLIALARVFPLRIDPAIKVLAGTDLIDPEPLKRFKLDEIELAAVQAIVDLKGRAIVVADDNRHKPILDATLEVLKPPVTIRTKSATEAADVVVDRPEETCWVHSTTSDIPLHTQIPQMKQMIVAITPRICVGLRDSTIALAARMFGPLRTTGLEEERTIERFKPHPHIMLNWDILSAPLYNIVLADQMADRMIL